MKTFGPLQSKIQAQQLLDELAVTGNYKVMGHGEHSVLYSRIVTDATKKRDRLITIKVGRVGTRQWVIIKELEEV